MLLCNSDQSLEATVITAITTNNLECSVEYEDTIQERITPGMQFTFLPVGVDTILNAPVDRTARRIIEIHILNNDTVTHDVIVSILNDVTLYDVKKSVALAVGKTLHYNRFNGWAVV